MENAEIPQPLFPPTIIIRSRIYCWRSEIESITADSSWPTATAKKAAALSRQTGRKAIASSGPGNS